MAQITIAFRILVASLRGTEVAIYDYAVANEELLGNNSIILIHMNSVDSVNNIHNQSVVNKFRKRFHVYFYSNVLDIERILLLYKCRVLYTIAYGERRVNDPTLSINGVYKTALHCVFSMLDPHADTYVPISEYLAEKFGKNTKMIVPHMISLKIKDDTNNASDVNTSLYRKKLGVSDGAIVFGRHGGFETFSIHFVHQVISNIVKNHKNIYFVLVNTYKFITHPQVIFLDPIVDEKEKVDFIMSCDAMIHARADGETFGIACGEFSVCNKPVITCVCGDTSHIKILGNKCITYTNAEELTYILPNFLDVKTKKEIEISDVRCGTNNLWDAYSSVYSAKPVIELWWKHLIEPCLKDKY
jgi:hypothetical protein